MWPRGSGVIRAAPSHRHPPATDGKIAVFFYGSGPLVAYDFTGRQLWSRNIQDDYGQFAFLVDVQRQSAAV